MEDNQFEVVPKLKTDERLVVYVEVGNINNSQIEKFIGEVKGKLNIPEAIYSPMRNGIKELEFVRF